MNLFFFQLPLFFVFEFWKKEYCLHKIGNIYNSSLKFSNKHRYSTKNIENPISQKFRRLYGANDSFCVLGHICILIIQI